MNKPTFQDNKGREYFPALDFAKLRVIRERTGLDFGNLEEFGLAWATVLISADKANAALWVSISDRAGITEDEWLGAMDGDSLEAGCDALLEAVKNFTRPHQRGMIDAGAARIHREYKATIAKATAMIEQETNQVTQRASRQPGTLPLNVRAS